MEEQNTQNNWSELRSSICGIIVNVTNYDVNTDKRYLIPFVKNQYQGSMSSGRYRYGLLNRNGEIVVEAKYDKIFDDCYSELDLIRVGVMYTHNFGSEKNPRIYYYSHVGLLNAKGEVLLEPKYCSISLCDNLIVAHKGGEKGALVLTKELEVLIPAGTYDEIYPFDKRGLARVYVKETKPYKNREITIKKWGVINTAGEIVLPLEYTNIWDFYNKPYSTIVVEKSGVTEKIHIDKLIAKNHTKDIHEGRIVNVVSSKISRYAEYSGSYAQDYMGYDDDTINDAFEGDPDACWNID